MHYRVNYTIYKDGEKFHSSVMILELDTPEGAIDALNEQPIYKLTDGKLRDNIEGITLEVNQVI